MRTVTVPLLRFIRSARGRVVLAVVVAVLVVTAVAAVVESGGGGSSALVSRDEATVQNLDALATAGGGANESIEADGSAAGLDGSGALSPVAIGVPRVVRTASLSLSVADDGFVEAFSSAATLASTAGGFVTSSTSSPAGNGETGFASLTLRVPADQFDEARRQLAGLGEVTSESIEGDDVGAQLTDLEARLRNLRAQEEAIRSLMTRAANVDETLRVQERLGEVRLQIERLDAQRAGLTDAVDFATISLSLHSPAGGGSPADSRLARAFASAVRGAESVVAGVVVVAGYLLPIAVLGLIILLTVRLAGRLRGTAFPAAALAGSGGGDSTVDRNAPGSAQDRS